MIQDVLKSITHALPADVKLDRDTALNYYEKSLHDYTKMFRESSRSTDLLMIDLLLHAEAEIRLVRDMDKAGVRARLDALKLIPDDDEEVEFRDASLLIINEIGRTLQRQ